MQDDRLSIKGQESWNVQPVDGMVVEPASLKVTGIDLDDPHRDAMDEASVLKDFFFGAFRNEAVRLPSSHTGGSQRILRPGIFTACSRQSKAQSVSLLHNFRYGDLWSFGLRPYGAQRSLPPSRYRLQRGARPRRCIRQNGRAVLSYRQYLDFQTAWLQSANPEDY